MRFVPVMLAATLSIAGIATAVQGQKPDAQVNPRSVALVDQAKGLRTSGNLDGATDLLESALAVDPKNRRAFLELADVAKAQGLPGKAIRFYREALELEPNDVAALAGQGDALVQKGAVVKARENLAKVKRICANAACPEEARLAALIEKGPPPPVLAAQQTAKVPVPGAEDKTRSPQ